MTKRAVAVSGLSLMVFKDERVPGPPPADLRSLPVSLILELVGGINVPATHRATREELEMLDEWADALLADDREGVRRPGRRLRAAASAGFEERRRALALHAAETAYCPPEAEVVAGVDEAGRGPLAGPVVAAAVVLKPGAVVLGLDDSKRVPEELREEIYPAILEASLSWGVGVAGLGLVERLNVYQASLVAMRRALSRLEPKPDYVLVDGFRIPGLDLPQRGVVHGDALCASIAAASIVAKVTRDRMMRRVGKKFPAYAFERNKGYATAEHWAALRRYGPCAAHRMSFLGRLRSDRGSLETGGVEESLLTEVNGHD